MKNFIKHLVWISLLLLPSPLFAWQWLDLWETPNQQGAQLLQAGKAKEASGMFRNKNWRAVALYRSGDYSQAFQQFKAKNTSDNQYNAGNAAALQEHYQEAINAYDKAIALNSNNTDAITNREIVKKLMNQKKQTQNNSSNKTANNKNNDTKDKTNNNSSSPQNSGQNNSAQKNTDSQQNAQNNPQKNPQGKANQQAQVDNMSQASDGQKPGSKPQNETDVSSSRLEAKDEDKKQLLRRLADDPGGLLRQKFIRDYVRRHTVGDNSDQGES
jgi:Ca-activated chloride channel family protein